MSHPRIQVLQGDITTLKVDAIVTAANESLCGGGGVDGAIHRAAGPALLEECRTLGICPEGEARISGAYLLPARHIIHTVGPVWEEGEYGEAETLKSCYNASLGLAAEHGVKTIAFPCIATGTYGFPKQKASEIALTSVANWLATHDLPESVTFCCFEDEDYHFYQSNLSLIQQTN